MALSRTGWRVAAVAGAVLIVGGGTGAWALTRSGSPTTPAYTLVRASTGTVQQTVSAAGTIEPAQRADLSFPVPGTVNSVSAAVGAKIAKGTVLATIDSSSLQVAVTAASASVTAAQQQVSSVTGSSAAQVAAATAQLAADNAALTQARSELAGATLTAPFAGTVAAVGVQPSDPVGASGSSAARTGAAAPTGGAAPAAGTSSAAGAPAAQSITVITTDAWVVQASVSSADLPQLRKGLQATITPTGSSARVFGTIASVGVEASSSAGGTAMFPVVIDVTGNPSGLYAGGSADVVLIVKQVTDVLSVPTRSLHTEGGATVVYRQVGGERVSTPVGVGTAVGPTTQITSGLHDGDQVEVAAARSGGTGGGGQRRGGGAGGRGTGGGGSGSRRGGTGGGAGGTGGGAGSSRAGG